MTHAPAPRQELDYPWADALPVSGECIDIAPGVRWLRMALPFALDHINLWLLHDEIEGANGTTPGWSVVDCGIADERTRSAWEQVFATQLHGLPVLRVIATHMHPDHVGLAHWLTQRWSRPASASGEAFDCRLWMSATDYATARLGSRSDNWTGGDAAAAFMVSHGLVDTPSIELIRTRAGYYASMVPQVPSTYRRLMDGDVLSIGSAQDAGRHAWRCHAGHGHAPEHIALHCASLGLLISGDMLLPRISTNVSVGHDEPEGNPLALFLTSLERMRALPADTLVLPSHGKPFRGLHARIDQLQTHHADRLMDVMDACAQQPCSAADLLPVLFKRQLDVHQTTFAMGESIAHLNALWHDGKLVRRLDRGIYRFSPAR
ncbi:MAG: MBL fold metallo-hydrolase [Burkholderiaceae bacterium]|nr:MBL fold metallo-hydrolase [Burkholderiaceae bacterium]